MQPLPLIRGSLCYIVLVTLIVTFGELPACTGESLGGLIVTFSVTYSVILSLLSSVVEVFLQRRLPCSLGLFNFYLRSHCSNVKGFIYSRFHQGEPAIHIEVRESDYSYLLHFNIEKVGLSGTFSSYFSDSQLRNISSEPR